VIAVARLGDLLLQEKLITPAQLEEALETQVVHGGRIGTNLVEHGFLQEADLARVLGRQSNLPFSAGEMVPDPAALAVAELQYYDDQDVFPMRVDATRLTVAVLGPNQIKAIDTLGFKAGKRVVAVVIPEFRMNQLLRKHCKAFRPMRPIDMNSLRPSSRQAVDEPRLEAVAELINENDFAQIYAQAVAGEEEQPLLTGEVVADDAPVLEGQVAAAPGAPPPPPPPAEPALPPLSFAEAQAALRQVSDREDIARTVLQFARSKFRRALILSVQGDLLTGWQGQGKGVTTRAVRRIGVTLREDNTFKMVRDLRSHFIGPMKQTPGMQIFYELLGGGSPKTAVILPLLVRGKPVHLLYLDQGPQKVTPPDIGELLIVSQGVTRSYEALIRKRQAARAAEG
jgi:hypothetical protein